MPEVRPIIQEEKINGRIFIVGCPRSGTTLLQSLLAAHPQVTSFPESHFFPHTVNRWLRFLGLSSPKAKERLYQFLSDMNQSEMKDLVPKYVFLIRQYTDAFVRILDKLTIIQEKQFWIEKTPRHLHFIDIIEKYIPGAKFIHVLRDGKDVVASLYEVTHKYPEEWGGALEIGQCIERWNKDLKITEQYIDKKNHMLVKYEDLVGDTQTTLTNVCRFIGIEFRQLMITQHSLAGGKVILAHQEWVRSAMGDILNANGKKFMALFDEKERTFIIQHLRIPNIRDFS